MSKARDVSVALEGVRRRFERWRRAHRPRSRISDSLWAAAVRAAGTCGIHRVLPAGVKDLFPAARGRCGE